MISPIMSNASYFSDMAKSEMEKSAVQSKENSFKSILHGLDKSKANKAAEDKKLKDASMEFESIFVYQMLKSMRATVPKNKLINGGMAEDIFQGMLDQEYAKIMSQNSQFGLGMKVYEQLRKGL